MPTAGMSIYPNAPVYGKEDASSTPNSSTKSNPHSDGPFHCAWTDSHKEIGYVGERSKGNM